MTAVHQRPWYVRFLCGMVHIKDPLLLIGRSSPYSGGRRFPFSLPEWSFLLPMRNSITRVIFIMQFPNYVITKWYVLLAISHSLMVRWVVGLILHGVDPLSYFSFQPVLHDWCNKGCGMYYPVCGIMHIKEPLLLIGKSSLCGGSRFPLSLSEWSFTICLTPYNRK